MALFSYSQEEEEDETHKAQLSINRKAKTMRQRRINAKLAAFKVVSTIYSSNNENNSTTSRHRLAIDSSSFLSKNVVFLTLFIVIMFLSLSSSSMIIFVDACQIQGTESGYCSYRYLPETYGGGLEGMEKAMRQWTDISTNNKNKGDETAETVKGDREPCEKGNEAHYCMPFCGKYIANYYPPCVPLPLFKEDDSSHLNNQYYEITQKDHNFPNGRFHSHTIFEKDQWVEQSVKSIIRDRITQETNYSKGAPKVPRRFYKNENCQLAFERYFCWLNFPRCDEETDETLPMCESSCINFFHVCGYDENLSLMICTDTYHHQSNGMNHEQNDDVDDDYYENDEEAEGDQNQNPPQVLFPGQPFRKNQYDLKTKQPKAMCTPSIKGSANGGLLNNERRSYRVFVYVVTSFFLPLYLYL